MVGLNSVFMDHICGGNKISVFGHRDRRFNSSLEQYVEHLSKKHYRIPSVESVDK